MNLEEKIKQKRKRNWGNEFYDIRNLYYYIWKILLIAYMHINICINPFIINDTEIFLT